MLNAPNRTNLRRFWRRYTWPLSFLWWTITMWITKPRRLADAAREAILSLPAILRYQYATDKPIDFMRHPLRVGLRRLAGQASGDCDDFASWRAWCLLRDGYLFGAELEAVWIMIVYMEGAAHALVCAENVEGALAFADYGSFEAYGLAMTADRALEIGRNVAGRLGRRGDAFHGCALARVTLHNGGIRFHERKVVLP